MEIRNYGACSRYLPISGLKSSLVDGGVYETALAPTAITSRIVSSSLPPVAITGKSGANSRIRFTIFGVSAAPETLKISTLRQCGLRYPRQQTRP
jgi:hypothetical protein